MKLYDEITFEGPWPVVLAAWPGMGNVGLITVDFLRKKLNAALLAEIDMSPFFIPDSIVVKNGIAQFPDIPKSIFYYTKNPNFIIFESDAQLSGRDGIAIIKMFLEIVMKYKIERIFTFAAFAQPMSYKDPSQILVTSNSESLLHNINQHGVIPMPDGYIAGLNGLLLGVAASRRIDAGCLLGTIPSYAMNFAYPKASLELVKTIASIQNIGIDTIALEDNVAEMDQQLALIEDRIREFFPAVNKENDDEIQVLDEEKVPHIVMEKIERLFIEAGENKAKAQELKKELDRWNLFELYENRFLDLFEDDKG